MIIVKVQIMPYVPGDEGASLAKKDIIANLPEGSTINDLLLKLARDTEPLLTKAVYDPNTKKLNPQVLIFVNGTAMQALNGFKTVLQPDDKVIMGAVMLGG